MFGVKFCAYMRLCFGSETVKKTKTNNDSEFGKKSELLLKKVMLKFYNRFFLPRFKLCNSEQRTCLTSSMIPSYAFLIDARFRGDGKGTLTHWPVFASSVPVCQHHVKRITITAACVAGQLTIVQIADIHTRNSKLWWKNSPQSICCTLFRRYFLTLTHGSRRRMAWRWHFLKKKSSFQLNCRNTKGFILKRVLRKGNIFIQ